MTPTAALEGVEALRVEALRLEDAGVQLGGRYIWRSVNLGVASGEFAAILGPNGAGKSTLLKALLGVLPLTEGSISVFGKRVRRGNDAIGYLPQRRTFDADLRVRGTDLVRLGLDGPTIGFPVPFAARLVDGKARNRERRVAAVVELVGATRFAKRPIGEMSGGEQQRILIAQALVTGARMLVLDEPLDSLDLSNQQAISSLVQQICQESGVTILLVAHDINPILPYVDRVVYVAQGQVVSGTPDEVIRTETLTRLYGTPVEVLRTMDGRLVVIGQNDPVSYHAHQH
ncbi:MAG: metal ABC transporter ATP-binding protein [Candidatus Dormibacteria bacterium]